MKVSPWLSEKDKVPVIVPPFNATVFFSPVNNNLSAFKVPFITVILLS